MDNIHHIEWLSFETKNDHLIKRHEATIIRRSFILYANKHFVKAIFFSNDSKLIVMVEFYYEKNTHIL